MLRRRTAGRFAAAALLFGLSQASLAHAFCRTTTCDTCVQPTTTECITEGAPLYWPVTCITYDVQQDASKYADFATANAIADASFASWKNVTCPATGVAPSFELANLGAVACTKHEYNDQQQTFGGNANIIVFRDDDWTATKDPHTLALTTVTYNKNTGEIYDADIEVNSHIQLGSVGGGISTETPVPSNSFDLQSILTHETGHFLGLAHSNVPCQGLSGDCPTMDAMYRTGSDDFRTLADDDIKGICEIYPPNRTASDNSCAPRHGFASECGMPGHKGCCSTAPGAASSRGGAGFVTALLGVGVFAARGRRRRAT